MIWKKYFNEIKKEIDDKLTFLEDDVIISDRDRYEVGKVNGQKEILEDLQKKMEDLLAYGRIQGDNARGTSSKV